jgi:hypothetical protein
MDTTLKSHSSGRDTESNLVRYTKGIIWVGLLVGGAVLSICALASAQERQTGQLVPVRPVGDNPSSEAKAQSGSREELSATREQDSRLKSLVSDLGADSYATRERATQELLRAGKAALPHLERGAGADNPEVSWRSRDILEEIKGRGLTPADPQVNPTRERTDPFDFLRRGGSNWRLPARRSESFSAQLDEMRKLLDDLFADRNVEEMHQLFDRFHRGLRENPMKRFEGFFEGKGMFGGPDERDRIPERFFGERGSSHRMHTEIWENGKKIFERSFDRFAGDDPHFGIRVESVTPALRAHLDIPSESGLLVDEVLDGTIAARAGLEQYDVIYEFDGQEIRDLVGLRRALRGVDPGGSASLRLVRGGKAMTLSVEIPQ